jgi:gliding motility-associated-like protein
VLITIQAINDPPMAKDDGPYATDEDSRLTVTATDGLLANDTDPENGRLSVDREVVLGPAHGTLTLTPDGSFTYVPNADYFGPDKFTYRLCDDGDNSSPSECSTATAQLVVRPVNDSPVVRADEATTPRKTSVTIVVLANDTDVEGDKLSVSLVSMPGHGTATLASDGSFTYTPAADFYGTDTFLYQACDQATPPACAQGLVTIRVIQTVEDVVIYEGISPNGDEANDVWLIDNIENYPNNLVRLFNRWGDLVFEQRGYDNLDYVWKGNANRGPILGDGQLPDGTYFYHVNLGNGSPVRKGYVVINR